MLRIALPSRGRLATDAIVLASVAGINTERPHRGLRSIDRTNDLEVIFVHPKDCAYLVSEGWIDIGVSAVDILAECPAEIQILAPLGFGACQLVIAVEKDSGINYIETLNSKTIVTCYPNFARSWFESKGIRVKIVRMSGALEVAPSLGLCSAILDSYQTGVTAAVNGLRVIQKIMSSQAVLIGRKDATYNSQVMHYAQLLQTTAMLLFKQPVFN